MPNDIGNVLNFIVMPSRVELWPPPLLFIETLTVLLCDKNYCDTFITMSYLTAKIRNVSEISTYFVGILRLLRYFCFDG